MIPESYINRVNAILAAASERPATPDELDDAYTFDGNPEKGAHMILECRDDSIGGDNEILFEDTGEDDDDDLSRLDGMLDDRERES